MVEATVSCRDLVSLAEMLLVDVVIVTDTVMVTVSLVVGAMDGGFSVVVHVNPSEETMPAHDAHEEDNT